MAQGNSRKFAGPAIGVAVALIVGFFLSNGGIFGKGGNKLIGSSGDSPRPSIKDPANPPVKVIEPSSVPAKPIAPTRAAVSIQVDPATNSVRYMIEDNATEPGKFTEQLKTFLEKNPAIKELVLTFPKETPAADVLAVQQAISSFPGVTYTVGEQAKPQ